VVDLAVERSRSKSSKISNGIRRICRVLGQYPLELPAPVLVSQALDQPLLFAKLSFCLIHRGTSLYRQSTS
jgi:hypothetical protein